MMKWTNFSKEAQLLLKQFQKWRVYHCLQSSFACQELRVTPSVPMDITALLIWSMTKMKSIKSSTWLLMKWLRKLDLCLPKISSWVLTFIWEILSHSPQDWTKWKIEKYWSKAYGLILDYATWQNLFSSSIPMKVLGLHWMSNPKKVTGNVQL